MAGTLATAFVRVRPQMEGFKSETEAGVRSSFSSLAKVAGVAFGGAAIGELIKNSIESAGQTQAQANAIRDIYGKAGKSIIEFAETGGVALGGLESSTEGFAVKAGLLFQNLGFGQEKAAQMTTNLTKLALAINEIRGGGTAGAAEVLERLTTSIQTGSLRGLNQLGLGLSNLKIQAEAFKLGLISNIKDALTPAQKATALYALTVQHLPQYLAQAKSRSDDFANTQARLSALWENAKTTLGEALLPSVTRLIDQFANWLQKMERSGRLQRDFNEAARIGARVVGAIVQVVGAGVHIWQNFADALGGAKNAIFAVLGALALLKTRGFGAAVRRDEQSIVNRIRTRIALLKEEAAAQRAAVAAPVARGAAFAAAHQAQSSAKGLSAAWATAHGQISRGAGRAAEDTKKIGVAAADSVKQVQKIGPAVAQQTRLLDFSGRIKGPFADFNDPAKVEAGIQRYKKALLSGQPLPKSDAFMKALADRAKFEPHPGPFDKGWVAMQKQNLASVVTAVKSSTAQIGRSAAGAARIDAGIQRFRQALLAGAPTPRRPDFLRAIQAEGRQDLTRQVPFGRAWDAHLKRLAATSAKVTGGIKTQFGSASQSATASISRIGGAFSSLGARSQAGTRAAVGHINSMRSAFTSFSRTVATQSAGFASHVRAGATSAASAFGRAATTMKIAAIEVGATIKTALIETGIGLLVVAIGIAVGYIITHFDQVKRYTVALGHAMVQVFRGLGNIIVGVFKYIGGQALFYLTYPIKQFVDLAARAAGWIPFIGGKISDAAHSVDAFYDSIHHFSEAGRSQILSGWNDITTKVSKAWADSLAKTADNSKARNDAKNAGKHWGKQFGDGATQTITQQIPSMSKTISDALKNAIEAAHQAILDSVRAAKDNLAKIASDLEKTIAQIQKKIGGAAGAVAGSPSTQAFLKLKKLIESGAPTFEVEKAARELRAQISDQTKTEKKKDVVSTQIADLAAAFNRGQITYRQFENRLHKILHDDGITLANLQKKVGEALAEKLRAQIRAIQEQAKAIADVPKRFRSVGGAGGAADIRIIRPLEVIKQEQEKVRIAVQKAAAAAQKQRAAQLKAQQKAAQFAQQMATVGVKVISLPGGGRDRQGDRHHHTDLLGQIRHHTRRTAEAVTRHHTTAATLVRQTRIQVAPQHPVGARTQHHHTELLTQVRNHTRRTADELRHQRTTYATLIRQTRIAVAQQPRHRTTAATLVRQTRIAVAPSPVPHHTVTALTRQGAGHTRLLESIRGVLGATHNLIDRDDAAQLRLLTHISTRLSARHDRPVSLAPLTRPLNQIQAGGLQIKGAVQSQHADLARALHAVCADIAKAERSIVAAELHDRAPMENLRRTELRIADHAARQRQAQLREQRRTNVLLARLHKAQSTHLPGYGKTPKGVGSHNARKASHAGVKA